ncbi:MAG: hypothetical protein AAF996_18145 [Pseudomonadota bacterium]
MPLSVFAVVACGGQTDSAPVDISGQTVERETDRGAVLALACTGCHSEGGGAIVSLSDHDTSQLRAALLQYKSELDGTTVMHRLARGYTEADIDLVSAYLEQAEADR